MDYHRCDSRRGGACFSMSNDLREAIAARHSVRRFKADAVTRDALDRLIEAAAAAPSAWNAQPAHFHVTTGAARESVAEALSMSTRHLDEYIDVLPKEELESALTFFAELGGAPVVIAVSVPVAHDDLERINDYLAAGCAIENLELAALDEGLGTCTITFSFWVRDSVASILSVPEDREIISMVLVGYPDGKPVSPRHGTDIATFYE